jgi:hypothetical protein
MVITDVQALANATAYLDARQLSLDMIRQCTRELLPDETVIFGGSIPEGLANADSDIDLLLIGAHPHHGYVLVEGQGETAFHEAFAPLKIHVESVPLDHVAALAGQMDEMVRALADPERARRLYAFPAGDLRLMHRVRTGISLRNPDVAEHWRTRLHSDLLPTYLLVLHTIGHFTLREDAIGQAREGYRESSVWMIKHALSLAINALLAAVGESHPSDKWSVRLLRDHQVDLGPAFVGELIAHLTGRAPLGDFDLYLRDAIELSDRIIDTALLKRPEVLSVLMRIKDQRPGLTTHVQH